MFYEFLAFVGLYALGCYLYDNLKSPVLLAIRKYKQCYGETPEKSLKERYGPWAAITGATDGIGKAYARELARRGLNVVLLSRTESKLKDVAAQIEAESKVQTKIIVADFTKGKELYEHIEKELGDLPIGILVNNVGTNTPVPGFMATFSADELYDVIHTNIVAVTLMSRLFLRRMYEAKIKGIIINISSGTELQPLPFGALYGGSKAFNRSLTLSLQHEAAAYGIDVQLVSPWFVVTKINSYSKFIMRGNVFVPDPDTYARWAVSTIGVVPETSGYCWHGFQVAVMKLLTWHARLLLIIKSADLLISKKKQNKLYTINEQSFAVLNKNN